MKEIIVSGYAYPSINPAVLEAWLPDLTFKYILVMALQRKEAWST